LVYYFLMFLSRVTGFSYKEVNIIIWFIIIPFSWAYLVDKIIKKHIFKSVILLAMLMLLFFIDSFSNFCNWLFDASADFLRSFDKFGSNYTNTSVIICIFIPIVVYVVLIRKAYFKPNR